MKVTEQIIEFFSDLQLTQWSQAHHSDPQFRFKIPTVDQILWSAPPTPRVESFLHYKTYKNVKFLLKWIIGRG
jgi:hypothetical protein